MSRRPLDVITIDVHSLTRGLADDVSLLHIPGVGSAAVVLPVVPEDAPPEVREGIARRRAVMLYGECPCGARRALPNRAERRRLARAGSAAGLVEVAHEDGCPAITGSLIEAARRWER